MKKNREPRKELSKEKEWKIFTSVLAVFVLAISIAFAITGYAYSVKEKDYISRLDDLYMQSYYDLMYSISGMETDLSKLEVSNDSKQQMLLLANISKLSEMACEKLVNFQTDNNFVNFTRYTNQVGDFSHFLMSKITRDEAISDKEYAVIGEFIKVAEDVKGELSILHEEMTGNEFSFYKHFSNADNTVSTIFSEMDNGSLNYPSLIYDGPFSDALSDRQPKELVGETYDAESGKDVVKRYMQDSGNIKIIDFAGTVGGHLPMLSYNITMNDGTKIHAEITALGGKLCNFVKDKEVGAGTMSADLCKTKGIDYLASIGIKNMSSVWSAQFDNIMFVNFATTNEDVILYSELIKVKIAMDTGEILGIEALNYIYNYRSDRESLSKDFEISEEEAIAKIKKGFAVNNVELCLIPMSAEREVLCYEISGKYNNKTYYIYVDTKSGNEVNILKVIGNLLQ